jgi:multidrug efflux pump subunit AcrA (membrane-fusion protein)
MSALETLPRRRADLLVRPVDDRGQAVVKNATTGEYFELGEEETFLLDGLDGRRNAESLRLAFQGRFGSPLSQEDLEAFLSLASANGFLSPICPGADAIASGCSAARSGTELTAARPDSTEARKERSRQSILYWRRAIFDPDRLLAWLEPKLRVCWTREFLIVSLLGAAMACAIVWSNRAGLVSHFPYFYRWQTWFFAWLVLTLVTLCHEFAHGLTCKHHGGEVHEIGFLMMFFIPCFYCNVSDAWLIREKSKRMWVTFAGAYCDVLIWSAAAFVWRIVVADSMLNYVAWLVLGVCGGRLLFNFNPLLKLDGYYLLSDWLSISNLRQRGWDAAASRLRWLLWGARRPAGERHASLLTGFGVATWMYAFLLLSWLTVAVTRHVNARWGVAAAAGVAVVGLALLKGQFTGISKGEVTAMLKTRAWRTAAWATGLCGVAVALLTVPVTRQASGAFQLRSPVRVELRAPVAGFVQTVNVDEGQYLSEGTVLAKLEVVDLSSRIAQKRAELEEAAAKLRLLEVGPRREQLLEERRRVERARAWRELAAGDLATAKKALADELRQIDELIHQTKIELDYAQQGYARARDLFQSKALSQQEFSDWERKVHVAEAVLEQHLAQRRARETTGTTEAESELARREKDLADARMTLTLLEAGTRPEEIEAQRAQIARLREELTHLEGLDRMLPIRTMAAGVVVTPHLHEKVGQYLREGDLLCVVEQCGAELEAEISIPEEECAQVRAGQEVEFKALAVPFETLRGHVLRVAPVAATGDVRSTVTVYCGISSARPDLRPGMTGYARVRCGRWPLGRALSEKALRLIRTEFWW